MFGNIINKRGQDFYNVAYVLCGRVVSAFAVMALDVIEARLLGQTQYAEWAYFFSILNICFFVGWAGINSSSKVMVSRCRDKEETSRCVLASMMLRSVAAVVVSAIATIVLIFLLPELGYPTKYPHLKVLVLSSFFLIILNSFADYYKHLFAGLSRFKQVFVVTISEYLLYLLFCWIFLQFDRSVFSVVRGYIFAGLTLLFIGFVFIRYECAFSVRTDWKQTGLFLKKITRYAIPMFVTGIGSVILIELDTFMLGLLSTKTEVAVYSIAKNITNKAGHVNLSLATGVMTSFAVITENEKINKLKKFKKYGIINIALAGFIAVCIFIFAPYFVKYVYGDEYLRAGVIFRALILFILMNALSIFYGSFLDFRGKSYVRSLTYIIVILLDVTLNYILIPRMGAMGAAIATEVSMLPNIIVALAYSYMEIKKIKHSGDMISEEKGDDGGQ